MNAPSQTLICTPEIEWSEPLLSSFGPSVCLRTFLVCVSVWAWSWKNTKPVGREKKRKTDKHSIARIRTRSSPPAVSFACRKLHQAAKETICRIRFIFEYHDHLTHRLRKKHFSRGCKYKYRYKETVKLIVRTSFAQKIKAEGSVTFQNIFSSMADFRAVVSVLPCSPTNKGKKNLWSCAENANRQLAFVDFWLLSCNIKTAAAFANWLAQKRAHFSV